MKRRHFLQFCSALPALTGFSPAFAQAPSPAHRLLILIYLKGGNDGFNAVVPYANPRYYAMRPTIGVPREGVIKLSETHGFNPALVKLKPLWDAGELALLQGIGLPEVHDQHYGDYERLVTGSAAGDYIRDGWLTRALGGNPALQRDALEAVAFGDLDIREGDPMGPFRGNKRPVVNVTHPEDWTATRNLSASRHTATSPATPRLNKISTSEPPAPLVLRTSFPQDEFGHALRATVELAARMPTLPVLHLTLNAHDGDHHHAFDTHWKQNDYNASTLQRLGEGLATLTAGLKEIGRWNDSLIVTYDEFGRATKENTEHGTHHGWANTQFVLCGRVKGGWHGKAPELIGVHQIGGPPPVIDYRALYTTVIESWWGGSANGLFDERFRALDLLRA
jgi:uncharacterized protein (DUF1501 family)